MCIVRTLDRTSGAIRCAIAPYTLKELDAAVKRHGFAEAVLMPN
jgi:hypothetical protein